MILLGGNVLKFQSQNKAVHKRLLLCMTLLSVLIFAGCGNNAELDTYKTNMNQFFENLETYDAEINAINPESESAVTELLIILDAMDNSFSQMAELPVPEDFAGVEELADEASSYMAEAVSYYHQAFADDTYNPSLADVAKQNYDRANLRIQYIISILHGDIPEEIYTYEDETKTSDES